MELFEFAGKHQRSPRKELYPFPLRGPRKFRRKSTSTMVILQIICLISRSGFLFLFLDYAALKSHFMSHLFSTIVYFRAIICSLGH